MTYDPSPGAWNPGKVAAFKDVFFDFLKYVKIDSKETGGSTRLGDNIYEAQSRALDAIFDALSEDIHDIKILKSRQLGITTITEALDVFWLFMHEGLQGAMIFDTTPHMEAARTRIVNLIKGLPARLKFPTIVNNNRYGISLSNRSELKFMSAGTRSSRGGGSLGASMGLNFIHASEMCSWNNDEGIASLRATMAKEFPNRLFIWESTARGFNAWHDMWEDAKSNDLTERAVFIGWWAKQSQSTLRGTPQFERYGIEPPTSDELERIREVSDRYEFDVTQEQLAWYRMYSNPAQEADDESGVVSSEPDEFTAQNQPWTEDEAFQQTGSLFFSGARLTEMSKYAAEMKMATYTFTNPTEFAFLNAERTKNAKGCHLKVWEDPEPHAAYILAADPAFGHSEDNDRSAIQIVRCYADKLEQVAEYAYAGTRTDQFAWICADLLGWYSRAEDSSCRFILEINGPGEAVWNEYKSLKQQLQNGYLHHLTRKEGVGDIFANVRNYVYTRADSMSSGSVWQWKTQAGNKVGLLERYRDFASNGTLIINSLDLLVEMRDITRSGDQIAATGRKKDDRVMAMALAIRAWEQYERRTLIATGKTKEIEDMKRRLTLRDQWSMLSSYQLKAHFARKASVHASARREEAMAKWRR